LNSGAPTVICDAPFGRGGAWSPDGTIVFSPNTQAPLMRVNASGGTPAPLAALNKSQHTSHRWPFFLPDGKHFLYLAINHDPSKAADDAIYYASLDGRENRLLLKSQSNAVYGAGYLLFARADQLMAQSFDADSGSLRGEAQSLAKGIVDDVSTWHMAASAASNGLLVFGSGGSADWQLVWLDRSGKMTGTLADKLTNLQIARISPQGDRVALQIDTGANDIWVLDLTRGVRTRLTFGPVANYFPVWSPDGKWIAYASERNGHSYIFRNHRMAAAPKRLYSPIIRRSRPAIGRGMGNTFSMRAGRWGVGPSGPCPWKVNGSPSRSYQILRIRSAREVIFRQTAAG
jgi:hypothetical protein